jgi:two-component system nitrate/nitrite response regulator NarL
MGEKVFPSGLAELLIEMGGSQGSVAIATRFQQDSLTDRECEILACLARGDSNKRIAMSLAITEGTVKVHLKHVRRKINVRNRTQAAVWVLKHGLPRVAGAVAADQPASGRRDQPAADGNAISRAVPEPVLG